MDGKDIVASIMRVVLILSCTPQQFKVRLTIHASAAPIMTRCATHFAAGDLHQATIGRGRRSPPTAT